MPVLAQQQGGKEGIVKQHARGRMTIRERIDVLLDKGTFQSMGGPRQSGNDDNGELIEYVPANYVVGFGQVDKRRIVAAGEDFTKGGSPNARLRCLCRTSGGAVLHHWCGCLKAAAAVSRARRRAVR